MKRQAFAIRVKKQPYEQMAHGYLEGPFGIDQRFSPSRWVVTHLLTGRAVAMFNTLRQSRAFIRAVQQYDWDFTDPKDEKLQEFKEEVKEAIALHGGWR